MPKLLYVLTVVVLLFVCVNPASAMPIDEVSMVEPSVSVMYCWGIPIGQCAVFMFDDQAHAPTILTINGKHWYRHDEFMRMAHALGY